MEATFAARLADYRDLRRDIEANILPLASSVDGRRFTLQAPLESLGLRVGGYVALESASGGRSGQVLLAHDRPRRRGRIGWSGDTTLSTRVQIRLVRATGSCSPDAPDPSMMRSCGRPSPTRSDAWLDPTTPIARCCGPVSSAWHPG